MSVLSRASGFALLSLLAVGCGSPAVEPEPEPTPVPEPEPTYRYTATVRRTSDGVPHISAVNLGSAAYGQGFAFARDHACTLLDQVIKVRGQRARYHGRGPSDVHLNSDFAYLTLDVHARGTAAWGRQSGEVKEIYEGYVAGFNEYLARHSAAGLPEACANKPWVQPITPADLMAYHLVLGLTGSSYQLIPNIAAAQPPIAGAASLEAPSVEHLEAVRRGDIGSNGWAIGAERSQSGRGMVMANPHFPWEGELRLWESHLRVPGQLNVYGAGLMGVPAVLIGFNEHVAWAQTFSSGIRMTAYALKLVAGKPTVYQYEGEERQMTARPLSVQVAQTDGTLATVTRTYYSSHYGPLLSLPGAEWNTQFALTLRDANIDNEALIAQYHAMNKAPDFAAFQKAFETQQGIPWVNTMAADDQGNTWYADASATPNLRPEAIQGWLQALAQRDPLTSALNSLGLVLLDGSRAVNEWVPVAGARSQGLLPFANMPQLARRDFVFNSNDSYWFSNPNTRLTGFSPLQGREGPPLSPRTRINALLLTEAREGGASGADGRFTLEELRDAVFSNRGVMAELLLSQVVQRCQGRATGTAGGVAVDITQACGVLSRWDGRYNTDSVGAIVWREFLGTYGSGDLASAGRLFSVAFSNADPIATPNTLTAAPASGSDPVLDKLAEAVVVLGKAGIALDAPLGSVQYSTRGGTRFALHGGINRDGVANVIDFGALKSTLDETATRGTVLNSRTGLTTTGYPVNSGTSFVMAMEFAAGGGVRGSALLTYGQSEDPKSPHFSDQTALFSRKQWRTIRFTDEEIRADTGLEEQVLRGN